MDGSSTARFLYFYFIIWVWSRVPEGASNSSDKDSAFVLLASRSLYLASLTSLRGSLRLGLLHDVLVGHLKLLYFLSDGLQGLRNLIYDLIQIIYYYAHFWHYFHLRFLY